jgi:hypothetical protein
MTLRGVPAFFGNPLVQRTYATDCCTSASTLGNVFVLLSHAEMPAGTLQGFQIWNRGAGNGDHLFKTNERSRPWLSPTSTTVVQGPAWQRLHVQGGPRRDLRTGCASRDSML